MGYRNYISRIKKKDLATLLLIAPSSDEEDSEAFWDFRHEKTEQLYEIGKYYSQDKDDNWVVDHDLSDSDTEYYIMNSKAAILSVIKQFEQAHIAYLENMLKSDEEFTPDELARFELGYETRDTPQQYVESQLRQWKRDMVINTGDNPHEVARSWSFEYSIFNLIHIYKNFDDEEYALVYQGY